METDTHDPQPPAERRGAQADVPARRWITAGWIIAGIFVLIMFVKACPAQAQTTYGGFADVGYLFASNDPYNDLFRSRGTAWHVDDVYLNMAGVYVKRAVSDTSRWGAEATIHSGKDDEIFGFSATAPNLGGADVLRHFGPTNVTYLADAGKGLTLQAGIFSSYIGYDSLYARDNFNYTRPWGADFTPYLMMGVNGSYPFTNKLTGTAFVVNGYWHLANANAVPSTGGQMAYALTPRVTIKETVLAGPHQSDTSFDKWRFISDTIVEHKSGRFVMAFNGHVATESVAQEEPLRAWWIAAQVPMQWHVAGPWRVSLRPEIAWDSSGRWTLAEQTVTAFTGTVEYRTAFKSLGASLRAEYRVDNSTGPQGGFFTNREDALTPTQHLIIGALILRFDGSR